MDASQYKDYVLVLLFVKYVSDKYEDNTNALIVIPEGGGFKGMIAVKGQGDIGDSMNKIIANLAEANDLKGIIDQTDFNDDTKLGKGKDMVDRLTKLIAIFENEALNFSENQAEGDDLLGDAYEYLMQHFATGSGKSKGQFYTPAEVSRIMAKVIEINKSHRPGQTIYDPTCGSGSLLLKAADESEVAVTIYGQENDNATAALAKMNMILHGNPTAEIHKDNTLSKPFFKNHDDLKTFDYVVANPPFSTKSWSNGFDPANDEFNRFEDGIPPAKNGDYAFFLHIIRSLKSTGKGAVILPHGVLFRGNAEAGIRRNIIKKGYIKGIIGLPANLFYGTGIPACIIVLDKEHAQSRKGIFMIDASKGFVKDGNKNRLRYQDIHKVVDVFNKRIGLSKFSRMVSLDEIEKNDYNLNISRYIDTQEEEDIQDIEAHLQGGIPSRDIEALGKYWKVFPSLRDKLFANGKRSHYYEAKVEPEQVKSTIAEHDEFQSYAKSVNDIFAKWRKENTQKLKNIGIGVKPKKLITEISEDILQKFADSELIDKYDVYQSLMLYWHEVMQDDLYMIGTDGWKAEVYQVIDAKGKAKRDEWDCDLIPKHLVINRYFSEEKEKIEGLQSKLEDIARKKEEMEEAHGGDECALSGVNKKADAKNNYEEYFVLASREYFLDQYENLEMLLGNIERCQEEVNKLDLDHLKNKQRNINQKALKDRKKTSGDKSEILLIDKCLTLLKTISKTKKDQKLLRQRLEGEIKQKINDDSEIEFIAELVLIDKYLQLLDRESGLKKQIKEAEKELDKKLLGEYKILTEKEIKTLVINDKWMSVMHNAIEEAIERISQSLSQRIKDLTERYTTPLPQLESETTDLTKKVEAHLEKMGFTI